MQYLGGKTRIAKHIAAIINENRNGRTVWDAFCGGLSVSVALGGYVVASDNNEALINTYRAVASGWIPPDRVSEQEYAAAKLLPDSDPSKAFIAIGCSFGGMWFKSYARDPRKNCCFAATAKRALFRDVPNISEFHHLDFCAIEPRPTETIIYCDPPYRGTAGYRYAFDHDRFYERIRQWSRYTDVYVSEYDLPLGTCIWEKRVSVSLGSANRGKNSTSVERLYHVRNA